MPVGARIFRDSVGKRWHAFWVAGANEKTHIISRSFVIYGDRPACLCVLYNSWLSAELKGSESSPHQDAFQREVASAGML